ncbi:NAD-dependent epimerase/dehydratase [Kalymmatonema gypsitolerans NIES-4073]|nr:NAD-dependent epimerase/dehydratase [Scytonema sp. NIES-4073]
MKVCSVAVDRKTVASKAKLMRKTIGKKNVLVISECGFIGLRIVEALFQRSYKVRILDNLSTGKLENIASISGQNVEVLVGDVADLSTVEVAMQGCEYVFHEATIASVPKSVNDPVGTAKVNYGGILNVLHAARKLDVRHVVFAGSAAVYGDEPTLPENESMPANPITPYGVDKLASEVMGHFYTRTLGLEFVYLHNLTAKNLQPIHKQPRPGDIRHSLAHNTALQALGWSPSISIREGLPELLQPTHQGVEAKK